MRRVKAVIEPDETGEGVLVMLPDGEVVHRQTPAGALATMKSWSARNVDVVIELEWRGVTPPETRS